MTTSLDAWIEISRPQVHGYTLSAVTSISTINHKHHLVTGADEKEPRVFDGTHSFMASFRKQYESILHTRGCKSKFIRDVVDIIHDNGHQFVKKVKDP